MRRPLSAARLLAVTLLLAGWFSAPALSHHGWGSYDADQAMTVEAAIARVHYRNPHASIGIDHDGRRWHVVLAPVSRMRARGLPDGALAVGRTVTIVGYPRRDGTPELRAERIVVDGKTVELR